MDISIYFDKTDYLGECTLNVIDQVMFDEYFNTDDKNKKKILMIN